MPSAVFMIKPASSLCNLSCRYCFYAGEARSRSVPSYGIMSEQCANQVIIRAYEYADSSCSFVFQGGEPTLAGLEFFRHFVNTCKRHNTKNLPTSFSIQTNGYDISPEMAEFFHDNNFLVGLSLDGYAQLQDSLRSGSFQRVMACTKLFDRYKVNYNILSVVSGYSARHGAKIYNFFKKCGFKYLQFIAMIDAPGAKSEFSLTPEKYAVFLKNTFDLYYADFMANNYISVRGFDNYVRILAGLAAECCGMNGECSCNFTLEADGSVYPCDFYALDEWRLGNVFDSSFEQLQSSETAVRFIESSRQIHSKCQSCEYFRLCLGGCRRMREPFVNGVPILNTMCEAYREFFGYALPRLKQMAQIAFK